MNLSELQLGQRACIKQVKDGELMLKLFEMGVLPGETVVLENIAPFGDPIAVMVGEYKLCIRLSDAANIEIELS